jgi:tRNA G18 (ribose-2'-O)-methylase SpoU
MSRGYFGIGIYNGKTVENLGTLWRSANLMGASFIYTIGRRYKKQASDTLQTYRHIPLYHYETFEEFFKALPYDCRLVAVELDKRSTPISKFSHHQRCIYLLGSEDNGLPASVLSKCHNIVQLPGEFSMNVAVAGSIIMYDRINKVA